MIAVIFEAKLHPNQQARYLALAADLKPLLTDISGFISIERFKSLSDEEKLLSLSWWENEDAVLEWKRNVLHAEAQQEGRKSIFSFYKISIVNMVREYSFTKDK